MTVLGDSRPSPDDGSACARNNSFCDLQTRAAAANANAYAYSDCLAHSDSRAHADVRALIVADVRDLGFEPSPASLR